jgi:hypothetical protein
MPLSRPDRTLGRRGRRGARESDGLGKGGAATGAGGVTGEGDVADVVLGELGPGEGLVLGEVGATRLAGVRAVVPVVVAAPPPAMSVPNDEVPRGVKARDGVVPAAAVPNPAGRNGGSLAGGLPAVGGGATVTSTVGASAGFAEAAASAAPQAMQGPLCRAFMVPQLLHFQVAETAMCRAVLSTG